MQHEPYLRDYSKANGINKKPAASRLITNEAVNGSSTHLGYYSGQALSSLTPAPLSAAATTSSLQASEDGALYTVDHLATFTVGESYELTHARDGIRRLRQMEKSSGIWTQRMYLRVESNWLVIIDYENGDTVERFPMDLVSEPTHHISQDPKELYNNILLFTVKEDPRSKGASFSEMHIFHCLKTSAERIADTIALLTQGSSRGKNMLIPPPPNNPPPDPPSTVNVMEKIGAFNHLLGTSNGNGRYLAGEDSESLKSDTTNYERDVTILNHCFDDIERFIARLQHASAAYKELERRRRQRKSKKKEVGDGMLQMRARAPAEAEFVDILQKFKLSFNLLGKLRSHIHDPNAPELIHFLFTPLALVVDACQDQDVSLASRVISPLLSQEAKQLLLNCLTSKESDLWQSLGEAWMQTQADWPIHVPAYTPVFHDGWQPMLSYGEPGNKTRHSASTARVDTWKDDRDYERESNSEYPYADQQSDYRPSPSPRQYADRDRERDRGSDFSDGLLSEFERRQRNFAAKLEAQGAKIAQVQFSRNGKNDKELSVQAGEILEIINDARNWWQTRNSRGQVGYVPRTIVGSYQLTDSADDAYSSYPPSHSQLHSQSKKHRAVAGPAPARANDHDRYSD